MMSSNLGCKVTAVALAALAMCGSTTATRAQSLVTVGIGTQDTTTNTVTAGTIIRQLNLLEKYLPKDGKYANIKFQFEWNNFTSGPPVTNGMMANKLHIGMMGDYPLVVNGFTFQNNPESKAQLIALSTARATGSWCTRTRPTSSCRTSKARWSACRSDRPPTAWC
jgi:NitT/TauT family transport system substrate-binding protein